MISAYALCVIALFSCKENKETIAPAIKSEQASISAGLNNPANPFNCAGALHNQMMERGAAAIRSGASVQSVRRDSAAIWLLQNLEHGGGMQNMPAMLRSLDLQQAWEQKSIEELSSLGGFSAHQIDLFNRILGLCDQFDQNQLDFSSLLDQLNIIEEQVLNDGSLNQGQKNYVLFVLSISKHSAFFWNDYYDGRLPVNGRFLGADAKGAILGSITGYVGGLCTGAIGGSIFGPVGTLGGACGGAIIGSGIGAITGAVGASLGCIR